MKHPFPVLRWLALAWLGVWATAYATVYGPLTFLALCDVAVLLTCLGLWTGSALLLSSQAVGSLAIDLAWCADLLWRAATGGHLVGGTEYMWDTRWPLWLRLMSLFHAAWPPLLLLSLRRVGYDRRGMPLQGAIAVAAIAVGRLAGPGANLNAAWRDPVLQREWGPPAMHVALMAAVTVAVIYWPTHRLLLRWLPARSRP